MKNLRSSLIAVLALLLIVSCGFSYGGQYIDADVYFEDGNWIGAVDCGFEHETDCEIALHVYGRRIDVENHLENENVFVSCTSDEISIVLFISNFSYENVADYTCLEDTSRESSHVYLYSYPEMIIQGVEEVGALVTLTCNAFYGAPIYWVLPGADSDNGDVRIFEHVNGNNSTTIATFVLQENDNYAEYKCCIKAKENQVTDIPCVSHTFIIDDSLQLISTYENYQNVYNIQMECVFRSDPTPRGENITWTRCYVNGTCREMFNSFTNTEDEIKHTLNSRVSTSISDYTSYICNYNGTSHTFNVDTTIRFPEVYYDTEIYYSTNGYAVNLMCTVYANPAPQITWSKTPSNEFTNGSSSVSSGGNYVIDTSKVSDDQWKSTLVIYPYDVNEDIATFTCTATNSYGQSSVQISSTAGPGEVSLDLKDSINDTYWALCTFQMFPFPPTYELRITSSQDIIYDLSIGYDPDMIKVTVSSVFHVEESNYPIILECTAFDRFNRNYTRFDTITIASNNSISN